MINLDETVLVNESREPDVAGDVSLFRSISDMERYLEPIDVKNGRHLAYTLGGQELRLSVEDNRVRAMRSPTGGDYQARIRSLLESTAKTVIEARRRTGIGVARDLSSLSQE